MGPLTAAAAHVPSESPRDADGAGPFPVAILVHGGGWRRVDKGPSPTPNDNADISPWFETLTAATFTWFSINYRHAPAHRWPACYEDLLTAIRRVKAHAAGYGGDRARIVLFGHSAGGHLVCLAATNTAPDTRVQAVLGFASVTDFLPAPGAQKISNNMTNLFGFPADVTDAALARLRDASPLHHAGPGLPPILLLHGDADPGVPLAQSIAFREKNPCRRWCVRSLHDSARWAHPFDVGPSGSRLPRTHAWLAPRKTARRSSGPIKTRRATALKIERWASAELQAAPWSTSVHRASLNRPAAATPG